MTELFRRKPGRSLSQPKPSWPTPENMEKERLDRWCDKAILALTLLILVFGPLAIGAVRATEFLILQGLVLALLLFWVIRLWLNEDYRLFWPPVCWVVLLFAGYAVVRYQQAEIEYLARQELIRVVVYAAVFLVTINNLHRPENIQLVLLSLVFLAGAISLYAIYQFLTKSPYVWHFVKPPSYLNRGTGTYICPNHLGGFLEMLLPVGISYAIVGRLGHVKRAVTAYCVIMILAGIGVTVSRGTWVATALALTFFFVLLLSHGGYRWPALISLGVMLLAGATLLLQIKLAHKRFDLLAPGKFDDVRFLLWRPALEIWRDHFWTGAGPAHFNERFRPYRPLAVQMRPERVHNDYLNTLADWGIIGLGIIGGFWVFLSLGAVKTWRNLRKSSGIGARGSNRLAFTLGSMAGLFALLWHSLVDFNMHIPANALLAVTLMALLGTQLRYATDRWLVQPHWMTKAVVSLLGLAALVYLGQQGFRRAGEVAATLRAEQVAPVIPDQIAALKQAHQEEPMNFETTYAIGELYRDWSWLGGDQYARLATEAMSWFRAGMALNPYDPYNYLRYGMCLDWLGEHARALPYFQKAVELDPLGYYVLAHVGWHYLQIKDYKAATVWFDKSLQTKYWGNSIAMAYREIINRRLAEEAQMPPAPK